MGPRSRHARRPTLHRRVGLQQRCLKQYHKHQQPTRSNSTTQNKPTKTRPEPLFEYSCEPWKLSAGGEDKYGIIDSNGNKLPAFSIVQSYAGKI